VGFFGVFVMENCLILGHRQIKHLKGEEYLEQVNGELFVSKGRYKGLRVLMNQLVNTSLSGFEIRLSNYKPEVNGFVEYLLKKWGQNE
jgi:hypothetical protein